MKNPLSTVTRFFVTGVTARFASTPTGERWYATVYTLEVLPEGRLGYVGGAMRVDETLAPNLVKLFSDNGPAFYACETATVIFAGKPERQLISMNIDRPFTENNKVFHDGVTAEWAGKKGK